MIISVVNGYIIVRLIHFVFNIYMFTLLTVESYIRDTDKPLHVYIQPKTIMITKLFVYKTPGNNNEYIIYKSYLLLYFLVLIIN